MVDPGLANLVPASLLLAAALLVPRLRPAWPVWLRMAIRIVAFLGLTVLIERGAGSPLAPHWESAEPGRQLWQQGVEAGWWLLAGRVAVGGVRLFVVLKNRPRETRILSDLLAGAVYVATLLSIVTFAFAVPLGGLLATSGVIAIVLGLALQSTLSDLFSGVAVGLEKPYAAGDQVWIEGGIEGQVIDVNWRSTRIATIDNNLAVIPNSVIAKSRLINRSAPTPRRGSSVDLKLDPQADPGQCAATLLAAARNCPTILDDPAPVVLCTGLEGDALGFKIVFSVGLSAQLPRARSDLFMQLRRHLRHDGITMAVPGKARPRPVEVPGIAELLARSDVFRAFDDAERAALVPYFKPVLFDTDQVLLREGEVPDAMLVIASGTAGAVLPAAEGFRIVNRLGPGETLGAAGLVVGQPFTATARALTPLRAFRLDKADLGAGLDTHPELLASLKALAESVVAAMRSSTEAARQAAAPDRERVGATLRNFLVMLGVRPPG